MWKCSNISTELDQKQPTAHLCLESWLAKKSLSQQQQTLFTSRSLQSQSQHNHIPLHLHFKCSLSGCSLTGMSSFVLQVSMCTTWMLQKQCWGLFKVQDLLPFFFSFWLQWFSFVLRVYQRSTTLWSLIVMKNKSILILLDWSDTIVRFESTGVSY